MQIIMNRPQSVSILSIIFSTQRPVPHKGSTSTMDLTLNAALSLQSTDTEHLFLHHERVRILVFRVWFDLRRIVFCSVILSKYDNRSTTNLTQFSSEVEDQGNCVRKNEQQRVASTEPGLTASELERLTSADQGWNGI